MSGKFFGLKGCISKKRYVGALPHNIPLSDQIDLIRVKLTYVLILMGLRSRSMIIKRRKKSLKDSTCIHLHRNYPRQKQSFKYLDAVQVIKLASQ